MLVSMRSIIRFSTYLMKLKSDLNFMRNLQSAGIAGVSTESLQMATAVITIGPIIMLYPFLQKYIVKGLVIGGVRVRKGLTRHKQTFHGMEKEKAAAAAKHVKRHKEVLWRVLAMVLCMHVFHIACRMWKQRKNGGNAGSGRSAAAESTEAEKRQTEASGENGNHLSRLRPVPRWIIMRSLYKPSTISWMPTGQAWS